MPFQLLLQMISILNNIRIVDHVKKRVNPEQRAVRMKLGLRLCNQHIRKDDEMSWDDEGTVFMVVINHEEQYSIWPDYKALPAGWREEGTKGSKQLCLDHIDKVWTDMRPLSLRQHLQATAS